MSDDAEARAYQARVLALGQFASYLFRRLGAPEHLVRTWLDAWNGGELTRLMGAQNELLKALSPPPKPKRDDS